MPIDRLQIEQYGRLEFLARQAVEGFITGMHKSPFHGFSVEFAEHRLYNSGESTRHIDWKLYARTDKLFVKRYEEETNLRCQLVIDHSPSMYFPKEVKLDGPEFNKIKFSVYAAAALTELFRRQRDAVGLSLFSNGVDVHTRTKSSRSHLQFVYDQLEAILEPQPSSGASQTTAVDALHEIAENIHRRSLVVLFSDMMDNSDQRDELFNALQHLKHNKHEVILFHTVDRKLEMEFDYASRPYTFVDMETGEQVKLNPNQVRDQYIEQMKSFRSELDVKCGQYGIDFVEADVNDGIHPILTAYLVKRSKMI